MLENFTNTLENKLSEAETNPDEDYNIATGFKKTSINISCGEQCNNKLKEGPNINLKYFKKTYDTDEEKCYITKKIRTKKTTELCKNWEIYHDCYYKDECSFAHGIEELRLNISVTGTRNKYCKTFQEKGYCLFGKRCNYRHIIKEKRLFTYQYILENNTKQMMDEINKNYYNETMLKLYKKILLKNKIIV